MAGHPWVWYCGDRLVIERWLLIKYPTAARSSRRAPNAEYGRAVPPKVRDPPTTTDAARESF